MGADAARHQVAGPVLHLVEDHGDIFTENPQEDELHAAQEGDRGDQRREAGHAAGVDDRQEHRYHAVEQAQEGDRHPHADTYAQRHLGEGGHAVDGELDQGRKAVFGRAAHSHARLERHIADVEADPADQAAQERIVLAQLDAEHVDHGARQQPEVRGAGLQLHGAHAHEGLVEPARGEPLPARHVLAIVADRLDDVAARLPLLHHLGYQLRRVLQVAVQHDSGVARRGVQARHQGQLVAETAGHDDGLHSRITSGDRLEGGFGVVAGRIDHVDEVQAVPGLEVRQHGGDPIVEQVDALAFGIDRADHIDPTHGAHRWSSPPAAPALRPPSAPCPGSGRSAAASRWRAGLSCLPAHP